MRKKIAALIVALTLLGSGLFAAATPAEAGPVAQAKPHHHVYYSDAAYTHATWIWAGWNSNPARWMNVKCHYGNYWHILVQGQTTEQACGGNGWIERVWVDADVYLIVRNDATGNKTAYPPGCNCSIGGGSYNMWLNHI